MSLNNKFMSMSLNELMRERDIIQNRIYVIHDQYQNLIKDKVIITNHIMATCQHKWIVDISFNCNEHKQYHCEICKMMAGYYDGVYYYPK